MAVAWGIQDSGFALWHLNSTEVPLQGLNFFLDLAYSLCDKTLWCTQHPLWIVWNCATYCACSRTFTIHSVCPRPARVGTICSTLLDQPDCVLDLAYRGRGEGVPDWLRASDVQCRSKSGCCVWCASKALCARMRCLGQCETKGQHLGARWCGSVGQILPEGCTFDTPALGCFCL